MTKNEIITEIYNSNIVVKLAKKYGSYIKDYNIDDFCQEIYLILAEMPDDKLINLYNTKQLDFYIISIIRNQATNDISTFNKTYNPKNITHLTDYENQKQHNNEPE